jgi:protein TonB
VVDWPDEPERPDRVHLPCRPPQVEDVVTRQEQDASSLEPRVLRQPAPIYPAEPGVNGEGWVDVRFTVDAEGRVCDAWIESAEPPGLFERGALSGLSEWRYEPLRAAGRTLAVSGMKARLHFQSPAAPAEATP